MAIRSAISVPVSGLYVDWRADWLATHDEPVLDPGQRIIDCHHHLWDRANSRYLFEEYLADLNTGHNVLATVYVDCRSMYRAEGPEEFRRVGEVEFVNGIAAMSASGGYGKTRVAAAIIGNGGLMLGAAVQPVLEAMRAAGGARFRGVRQVTAWDDDFGVLQPIAGRTKGMLQSDAFRAGFACLGRLGLSYDAFMLYHQLGELEALARDFPDTPIVVDHLGSPIGVSSYAGRHDEMYRDWRAALRRLARCDNVMIKLGGLGMRFCGFDLHTRPTAPSSEILAAAWRPYIDAAIEIFGPARCMFESNFPPDKGTASYVVLWNAFKRLAAGYSNDEREDLFWRSAARFYRLGIGQGGTA